MEQVNSLCIMACRYSFGLGEPQIRVICLWTAYHGGRKKPEKSHNSRKISMFSFALMNSLCLKVPKQNIKVDVKSLNSNLKVTSTNPLFWQQPWGKSVCGTAANWFYNYSVGDQFGIKFRQNPYSVCLALMRRSLHRQMFKSPVMLWT